MTSEDIIVSAFIDVGVKKTPRLRLDSVEVMTSLDRRLPFHPPDVDIAGATS
jgi:hypothetical protein